MGKPRRPPPQRPLSGAYRLRHRRIHSRTPAQPPLHTRTRADILLPKDPRGHSTRLAYRAGAVMRNSRSNTLRTRARLRQSIAMVRTAVRQHPRHELQHGRPDLCRPCRGMLHLGRFRTERPAEHRTHKTQLRSEHPPFRYALHRPFNMGRHTARSRPRHRTYSTEARASAHIQRNPAERAGNLHRLLVLRPTADPRIGQHPDEPERARQRIRTRFIPEPRTIRRTPALLWSQLRRRT